MRTTIPCILPPTKHVQSTWKSDRKIVENLLKLSLLRVNMTYKSRGRSMAEIILVSLHS